MKLRAFFSCAFIIALFACSNNKKKDKSDPTNITVPSNSDATNPSLADTAYTKYDSSSKKDTLKR